MKIGILTFHNGPNYGGFLQAWHMREAVRGFGYHAEIINYQNRAHAFSEKPKLTEWNLSGLKGFVSNWLKFRPFRLWITELNSAKLSMEANEIDWDTYDAVVVGSDVVWDYRNPRYGADPVYFSALPELKNLPFISYAASCGEASLDCERPAFVNEGLARFKAIRVRDDNTARIVEACIGERPQVVCDPTWLNESEPGETLPPLVEGKYLAVYGPNIGVQRHEVIRKYAEKHGLQIVAAGSACKFADRVFRSLSPPQWLSLLRYSQGVVTSTLHGSHYAMKFQKPMVFLAAPNSKLKARKAIEMAGRIESWLDESEPLLLEYLERHLGDLLNLRPLPEEWIKISRDTFKQDLDDLFHSSLGKVKVTGDSVERA